MVSHLDKKNNPIMVDVGGKDITNRTAEAEGEVVFDKITFKKIENAPTKSLVHLFFWKSKLRKR